MSDSNSNGVRPVEEWTRPPQRPCGCPDCACPLPIYPKQPDNGEERCLACTVECRVPPFAAGIPAWVLTAVLFWLFVLALWWLIDACEPTLYP